MLSLLWSSLNPWIPGWGTKILQSDPISSGVAGKKKKKKKRRNLEINRESFRAREAQKKEGERSIDCSGDCYGPR